MEFSTSKLDRKTILRGLRFAVIVSLFFSVLIIMLTIDREALQNIMRDIEPVYLFLALIILFLRWLAASLLLKTLVSAVGDKIPLYDAVKIYLSGAFIANVTPFASGGGPFQIFFLHKKGVNIGSSSVVIIVQLLLRIFFFGSAALIFLIFFNDLVSRGYIPAGIFYTAFGGGLLVSLFIVLFTLLPRTAEKILQMIFSIKKIRLLVKRSYKIKRFLVKARKELREFRRSLEFIGARKGYLLLGVLLTVLNWSLLFLLLPVILYGLGGGAHFFQAYVMQTIFYLIIPFMPTPGASGIAEIGFASLFVSFIPGSLVGLVLFGWRLFSFYIVLLVGGYFALREISNLGSKKI